MPDFVAKQKRGCPKENTHFKSALEMAMRKKRGRTTRKLADDDDDDDDDDDNGLGMNDVEFGFGVSKITGEDEVNANGQEGEI